MAKVGKVPEGAQVLVLDIVILKYQAGKLGLWKTMHALDSVTQAVGWELAEILDGKRPDHLMEKS